MKKADFYHIEFPNLPKRGQVRSFYEALGRAISAWQSVERGLHEVFRSVAASNRPGAIAAAFFSLTTLRAKLSMTEAAAQFALYGSPLLKDWDRLAKRIESESRNRNRIAHQVVYVEFHEVVKDKRVHLSPEIANATYSLPDKRKKVQPYTAQRLRQCEKAFRSLARDLQVFSRRIPEPKAR